MVIGFNHVIRSGYGRGLLNGVLEFAGERPDVHLWFTIGNAIPQDIPERIDGMIGSVDRAGLRRATPSTMRVNVNSEPCEGAVQVCSDNEAIANLALDHFIGKGIRSFAFLDVAGTLSAVSRRPVFEAVCESLGYSAFILPTRRGEWSEATANERLVDLLRALPKPTGVLLPQDDFGFWFIGLCTDIGLRVPEDIAVLGINNRLSECQSCQPMMSSIDIAAERIGYEAARTVVDMIEGREVPAVTTVPPADLIQRGSTDVQFNYDANVMKVLDFMHANLDQPIEKEDLIQEQALGRRALEKHFKASFGEAPMQYLRSLRLHRARHLIESTDSPVVEIAAQCGIPDSNYLCRLFRARFGYSPLEYRKGRHSAR